MHGEKEDGEKERRRTHGHICLPLRQNCLVGIGIVTALLLLGRLMSVLAGGSHRQAAFAMSLGAGMATGVGASFVLCTSTLDRRLLACTMAFSAGVMIYVSLVEVVGVSTEYFEKALKPPLAYTCGTASVFAGVAVMALVDRIVHAIFEAVGGEHSHGHHGKGHGAQPWTELGTSQPLLLLTSRVFFLLCWSSARAQP